MSIVIPEVVIYKAINACLTVVKNDWNAKTEKSKTILSYVFRKDDLGNDLNFNNFNWFEQAQALFIPDAKVKRKLDVHFGYNLTRTTEPSIHIMLPNESPSAAGIGGNEGYLQGIVDAANNEYIPVYAEHTSVTYQLLVTSNNYNEVLLIYYFIKALLMSIKNHLELSNFQNVVFGGNDLVFSQDVIPAGIYHRSINITFTYDFDSIDILTTKFGTEFTVNSSNS